MDFLVQPQDSSINLAYGIYCPNLKDCTLCDRCGFNCPTFTCVSDGDVCGIVASPWSKDGLN